MYPKKCAECGGAVGPSRAPISFEVRGERVSVPGIEHGLCAECGEEYLSLDAAEALQKEAIRRSKASMGLLAPDEIRALRHSLSMSQSAFESLLGVGPKTVVRWEKGTVFQSATADRLMRLLIAEPRLVGMLAGEGGYAGAGVCAARSMEPNLAGQWQTKTIHPKHLRLVRRDDDATAA